MRNEIEHCDAGHFVPLGGTKEIIAHNWAWDEGTTYRYCKKHVERFGLDWSVIDPRDRIDSFE